MFWSTASHDINAVYSVQNIRVMRVSSIMKLTMCYCVKSHSNYLVLLGLPWKAAVATSVLVLSVFTGLKVVDTYQNSKTKTDRARGLNFDPIWDNLLMPKAKGGLNNIFMTSSFMCDVITSWRSHLWTVITAPLSAENALLVHEIRGGSKHILLDRLK